MLTIVCAAILIGRRVNTRLPVPACPDYLSPYVVLPCLLFDVSPYVARLARARELTLKPAATEPAVKGGFVASEA